MAKAYWYDGFMDKNDASALDLLLGCNEAVLVGLSESFHPENQNTESRTAIERKTSLKIYAGSQRPIIAHASIAREYAFDKGNSKLKTDYAWDAMYKATKKAKSLTLLCTGSMTNIALALLRYDDFSNYIERIIFDAGTVGVGDSKAMSENKAAFDAYAMKTVLTSGVKLLYVGMGSWNSNRISAVDLVSCALNIDHIQTQKANMDIETAVCDQFARTIIDMRVTSKAEKNIEFIFIDKDSKENL